MFNQITPQQVEEYHISKIQGELVLPYSWVSHQFCLEMLKGVKDKEKKVNLRDKIFERFSIGTNAHQTTGEK